MSIPIINRLLKQNEGTRLEYKEARSALPRNLFETICAMLNRDGGDILLGVDDTGKIQGIEGEQVEAINTDLVNLSNNEQKLDPPFILFPKAHQVDGEWVIHIQVPSSSLVHKTRNKVYDRSNDGDFIVQ